MKRQRNLYLSGSILRSLGLPLLILILLFQLMVSAASASTSYGNGHHSNVADMMSDCPVQAAKLDRYKVSMAQHGDQKEAVSHCMPSMCCFYESSIPIQLSSAGLLLPGALWIERHVHSASRPSSTQDRPPKRV